MSNRDKIRNGRPKREEEKIEQTNREKKERKEYIFEAAALTYMAFYLEQMRS